MKKKLLVIISTGEKEKARIGAMYAKNALLQGWMEDVKIIIFGPAQALLLEDSELQDFVKEVSAMESTPIACSYISDRDKNREELESLGVLIEPVGSIISDYINDGYIPMIW